MIDVAGSKVGRVADATFDQDIFGNIPSIVDLEVALAQARTEQIKKKKRVILQEFRVAIQEFRETWRVEPTSVAMSYNDINYLVDEYNKYNRANNTGVETVYSCDNPLVIDGIKVKQGCDTVSGCMRIYQLE